MSSAPERRVDSMTVMQRLDQDLPSFARTLTIISSALAGGVVFFAAIVFLGTNQPGASGDPSILMPLTYVVMGLTPMAWVLSFVIPPRIRGTQTGDDSEAVRAMLLVKSRIIAALAFREGPALLGLTVCIIATTGGLLSTHRWVVIDTIPAAVFVLYTLATLPNVSRLRDAVTRELALT